MNIIKCTVLSIIGLLSLEAISADFSAVQRAEARRIMALAKSDTLGYQLVESLTTEVGPRLAGTPSEARARDWAVRQFKRLGFDNVRVENFPLKSWTRVVEHAEVLAPFPQPLVITALGGSLSTPPEGVSGEIVRYPDLKDLKAVPDGALSQKIVFVDEVMARTRDGSGYGTAVSKRREVAFESFRAGAKAALIRSVGTSTHRFAHTGQMKSLNASSAPGASVPTAALSAPDADQLTRMLNKQQKVVVKIRITSQIKENSRSGNVIGEIRGTSRPNEIVLLGAHLDSWDLGTGAVDDGAGVGIVMSAAALIKKALGRGPERTLRVVLFGAEEVGLVGAFHYAKTYKHDLDKHIIAAESDFGADVIWKLGSVNVADEQFTWIKRIQEQLQPLNIILGNNKSYGGPDLIPLREMGLPIAELKQDGSDYFDLHHTANDTLDKVDLQKLRQNIAAYAGFAYLVASSDIDFKR